MGLRRRGLDRKTLEELKRAFHALDAPVGNLPDLAARALQSGSFASAEARAFLEFFQSGRRGFVRTRRGGGADGAADSD